MNRLKLYLMFGYPGAGKTTAAKVLHQLTGAVHLQSDTVRLELFPRPEFTPVEHHALYKVLDQRTEQLLRQGKSVIYDANLNRYQHRKRKYDLCKHVGAEPVLLWVKTPKDIAHARATHDSRSHLWPANETPTDLFNRIAHALEEPGPNEPYRTLDGTKVTPEHIRQALQKA